MIKFKFLLLACLLFSFCSEPPKTGRSIIIAENMEMDNCKVYLTTMEKSAFVLDSAEVVDGRFQLNLPDNVEPFEAYIAYKNKEGNLSMIYFKDIDHSHNDSLIYSECFIVEHGTTHLKGESPTKSYVFASVTNGKENKLIFNPEYESLGMVNNSSKENYKESMVSVMKMVNTYPFSSILVEKVYANRGNYTKQDLETILSKMDAKVKESAHAYNLGIYLKNLPDNYDPFKAFPIINKKKVFVTDYDRKKKLNMLIFTATWSYPSILLLYYMDLEKQNLDIKDLNIVDIGLDEVESWWWDYKAIKKNNFIWDELYVPTKSRQNFLNLNNIDGFPVVIFTDQDGKELMRHYDEEYKNIHDYKYNSKNLEEMKIFIKSYLNN